MNETSVLSVLRQSSSWQSMATPRLIQCCGGRLVGSVMVITKLVECPVVDSVPRRSLVLYSGHTYSLWEGWPLVFSAGRGERRRERERERERETGVD